MNPKPVVPREQARRDADDAVAWHIEERADEAALGFIDALTQADEHLSRHPATGSHRHAQKLGLPGLRLAVGPVRDAEAAGHN